MPPTHITRTMPKRSASMPANGCTVPHSRFWIAIAKPKTSRPHSFACDCGVRNNPSVERVPKFIIAISDPASRMTTGVRQPMFDRDSDRDRDSGCDEASMSEVPATAAADGRGGVLDQQCVGPVLQGADSAKRGRLYGLAPPPPNESSS